MQPKFGPKGALVTVCLFFLTVLILGFGCGTEESSTDISETGQQIGDAMASVDESGGSTGSLAILESTRRIYVRLAPSDLRELWQSEALLPTAHAVACSSASTFGSWSNNVIRRTFGSCTIGSAVFEGNVALTWGGTSGSCVMQAANDFVTLI